jgi:hypothetical protein
MRAARVIVIGLCVAGTAFAEVDRPFHRDDEVPTPKRYTSVDGRPARAHKRNTTGAWEAWTFADGTVEHAVRWDKKHPAGEVWYDEAGDSWANAVFADDKIIAVTVHGIADRTIDVSAWAESPFPAAAPVVVLSVPPVAEADGVGTIALPDGVMRVRIGPKSDVFADGFRDAFTTACACDLLDRQTWFVGGKAGAHYLFAVADPDAPQVGEAWAVPLGDATFLATYVTAAGGDPPGVDDTAVRLAPGRAAIALVRWGKS